MDSRDYYKVSYNMDSSNISLDSQDLLDNDTEFNANQFKLYDDFTTDLRISFNQATYDLTQRYQMRRRIDPNDSGVDVENGNRTDDTKETELLENEVMVDPWSSMDSSNSPLTDSVPSASEDCTPSTSSEARGPLDTSSPLSPDTRRLLDEPKPSNVPPKTDRARSRDLTLELDPLRHDPLPRRPHFLDEDPSESNIECRIPKPHFLDHSPSPDGSDITNPNFLDDEGDDQAQKKAGALPKRPAKPSTFAQEVRPHRTSYRTTLHYGLENSARSSERDKRASQLYRGTWPGERDVWTGQDSSSVRSFSSNGSNDGTRPSSNLENKIECVCSLISLLSLSPENNADLSGPLLEMSRSVESCIAMRQAGCIPLLVQLIHSKVPRETRDRAAKALRNIIHTQTDDKAGRREARVWRLLEQVREYCYVLEDIVEARKEGKELVEDDNIKHPSQSVAALMKLSFDEEHRHVVCQFGGLQALAALVSGDQAAHGSRTDDNTCLTMRKYAGMTLTNLTFGDGNNKSLLCSFKDFMLALVEQLESPNDDMRQVTAAVLRNLSWRADSNSKQVLREVGAVKGLTKAAMTCQKEATLKSVLSALWNLTAHCSMNKVALCSVDGALGFLVDMLSYDSPTKTLAIVENAGGIMRNVSSHIAVREDYRQILRERNCLSVLLQHLKSPSLTVVSNSCGTLWNLSARCPQDQQYLWDNGAVPMLRSLIHSKHKMIAMGSSAALKNLLNSKPGKTHIISLDTTARNMNLPALPTLGVRKQKALEQELDQNLAETCDNIEPATSPSTSNREEKNLFTATERQIAMNLERHRMTSSSPLMGALASQISLSHSAHLASYLSCSNTLLKGALVTRSSGGSSNNVNRSDSKDSVTSTHSDSVFERVMRTGKVPIPTPRNKDLVKSDAVNETFKVTSKSKDNFLRYPSQPPIPPPRSSTDMRTNYTESGYDVDQDSCDQPVDYSRKYSETKNAESDPVEKKTEPKKYNKKESPNTFGDYQETDLDQPTDYSLRYAEHQSETGSDISDPPGPSVHEDTIKHFATEGTPYETPIIFSTATSMSDLRVIGKDGKPKAAQVKENPEVMTHSDEKDTCSIEDPPKHDNDRAITTPQNPPEQTPEKRGVFDTKFSSGMISPEKPVNYCDEGTPGYFSRVSSLSSLGEPTEEDSLAKKNAMATINVDPSPQEQSVSSSKDKEGCKAVTFACEALPTSQSQSGSGLVSGRTSPPRFVEDTPLMFSRTSSLGSLPDCSHNDDHGSVVSEVSRLTSGCISPSEIPDSPCAPRSPPLVPATPRVPRISGPRTPTPGDATEPSTPPAERVGCGRAVSSVFEESVSRFVVEHTPAHFSNATSLSSLTIDDEPKQSIRLSVKTPPELNVTSSSENQVRFDVGESSRPQIPPLPRPGVMSTEPMKGTQTPRDTCKVYFTEDTPAILSKAGSNSNLSVLSIDSAPTGNAPDPAVPVVSAGVDDQVYTANESFGTDARDTSDSSNLSDAGDLLEECIQKGIAEVVKNKGPPSDVSSVITYRDEFYVGTARNDNHPASTSPPHQHGNKRESRLPVRSRSGTAPAPANASTLRDESLSSLSNDSFGSTDREIFEETVKAGLSSVNLRPNKDVYKQPRVHKSLDRGDRFEFSVHRARAVNKDLASSGVRGKKVDQSLVSTQSARSPGAAGAARTPRIERSNSLSSLSNESFGSTDAEVFERCVRAGMTRRRDDNNLPMRVRSDDRDPRHRRRHYNHHHHQGALDRMRGDEYSKDRAILEEVIARGAGDHRDKDRDNRDKERGPKNVPTPSAARAAADGHGITALPDRTGSDRTESDRTGSDGISSDRTASDRISSDRTASDLLHHHQQADDILHRSNELPTVHSANTTIEYAADITDVTRSNECLAPRDANTTLESEIKDELNRSNESYADVLDGSWSDAESANNYEVATLTRKSKDKSEWTDIKNVAQLDASKKTSANDTWNDNTCPDDVTFPTISGSVHMVSSLRSEIADAGMALPDLLEKSDAVNMSFNRPDLTDKLDEEQESSGDNQITDSKRENDRLLDDVLEPSYISLADDGEHRFDSIMSSEIEKEAARLAAQLKNSQYAMESSVTSLTSMDLDHIRPPSNLGSLLSLSASGHWDESSAHTSKKSQKSRKKSLPVALMVKRALSNSMHQGSSEHLDSNPVSFLDNVKPPSEMDHIDMESSIISVSSIVSEVAENKIPVVFDLKQPIQDFPLCNAFNNVFQDLENVNPPSLFNEMTDSTIEIDQTTAHQLFEDCTSTLNVVTDIPSGSENCTPLPSDMSSVESTPKRQRSNYLTPKEKRYVSKDRYQTYTITDTDAITETDIVLEVDTEEFMTWTKSESERSEDYVTSTPEFKSKRKLSAKQRRMEDRARYQTQTVDIQNIIQESSTSNIDPHIASLKQRLAAKKTLKQRRLEDAERFRTRTLSEDIPPSPTFVTKDANFENVETTTGYDSLSSNELNHQQILDDRSRDDEVFSRDIDSGNNEDDFELNSTQMQTYTKSFRNYLPVIESPSSVDMCVVNNLKNIEMTASYRQNIQDKNHPSSSDFASFEGDSNSEDKVQSESDNESPHHKPKPKIIKPAERRDESLDSNESGEQDDTPKAIRGRKKAMYVSPYRRNISNIKKPNTALGKSNQNQTKPATNSKLANPVKAQASAKTPNKGTSSRTPSASTSPKKSVPNRSPSKMIQQKPVAIPLVGAKPLPLERQGTFTKEESTIPPKDLPVPDKKTNVARVPKTNTPVKPVANVSPSRLPQRNRFTRPPMVKANSNPKPTKSVTTSRRPSESSIRNSASNHSLQSNESGKTITLNRASRQGSTSSVNSQSSKTNAKDVESKIASLWKKVEQSKKQPAKADKRVWIESDKVETPKLIRSSTFEGQPKSQAATAAPKQKSAIGMKVSQIPSLRPKSTPSKIGQPPSPKKSTNSRVFARKQING